MKRMKVSQGKVFDTLLQQLHIKINRPSRVGRFFMPTWNMRQPLLGWTKHLVNINGSTNDPMCSFTITFQHFMFSMVISGYHLDIK